MAYHPVNLALRFLLELSALGIFGYFGFKLTDTPWKFVWLIILPLAAAVIWGVFAVPEDPSRSGNAPVPVSGILRLILELLFFASAGYALYLLDYKKISLVFCVVVVLHYVSSYNRISWLVSQ